MSGEDTSHGTEQNRLSWYSSPDKWSPIVSENTDNNVSVYNPLKKI